MLKNLTGGAVINYGPTIPASATEFDGALFQLTATDGQYPAGLYIFSSDSNLVTQSWRQIFAASEFVARDGDRMSGPLTISTSNANTGFGQGEDSLTFNNTANTVGARSGAIRWTNNWTEGTTPSPSAQIDTIVGAGNKATLVFSTAASNGALTERMRVDETGVQLGNSKVWTQANDGAGSGLDADLLDGLDSTYFRNANNLNAGTIPQARLTYQYQPIEQGGGPQQLTTKINIGFSDVNTLRIKIGTTDYAETWPINIAGIANQANSAWLATKASTVALGGVNGTGATFSYLAQTGQPVALWGTPDSGVSNFVYNPANFNVASAATSTLAAKASTIAQGGANGTAMTFNFQEQTGISPFYVWGSPSGTGANAYVYKATDLVVKSAASADAVAWTNVTGRPTNVSQFTNNSGYITTAANTFTSVQTFSSNANTGPKDVAHTAPLRVGTSNSTGAVMTFHKGDVATNMGLDSDSIFRIGGWSWNSNRFQMDSSGNLTMAGNVTAYSDRRLKKDIEPIRDALSKVDQLTGVTFTRLEDNKRSTGLIAQDVQSVLPEAVIQHSDGMLSLAYGNMVGLLVEAIHELSSQVKDLKAEVEKLKG